MGLFSRRNSGEDYDGPAPVGSTSVEVGFAPRGDGDYRAGPYVLRFARPVVTETDPAHPEAAVGEFTDGGRFSVQRPFARPVVYTVLAADADGSPTKVRRTDTGTRDTAELDLTFDPDSP